MFLLKIKNTKHEYKEIKIEEQEQEQSNVELLFPEALVLPCFNCEYC